MSQRNGNMQRLYCALVAGLAKRRHLPQSEAHSVADAVIEILCETVGGDRIGQREFYIPSKMRSSRNEKILRLAGPGPHSRRRIKLIAAEVKCHEATVWRVLAAAAEGQS